MKKITEITKRMGCKLTDKEKEDLEILFLRTHVQMLIYWRDHIYINKEDKKINVVLNMQIRDGLKKYYVRAKNYFYGN